MIIQSFNPIIKLVNPDYVRGYLESIGNFATTCTAQSGDKEKLERIGLDCLRKGHMSPARWQPFVFSIENVSRIFSHQFVRHRVGIEVNQESQRYVEYDNVHFVLPKSMLGNEEVLAACEAAYRHSIASGLSVEDSRYLLPNCATTKLSVAATFQALEKLCADRLCTRASEETRLAVSRMRDEVIKVEPRLAEFLVRKCANATACPEGRKVKCLG